MPIDIARSVDALYMQYALTEARQAAQDQEVPIGAVVVSQGQLLGKAHNQPRSLTDPTAHAEILALTAAAHALGTSILEGCTLYVTIEPCPMCASALYWARLGRLVYGAKDSKRGYSLFSPSLLHPKTKVVSGVLEGECRALMQEFFARRR
jgi:tRNA-specific adenosine deaminase